MASSNIKLFDENKGNMLSDSDFNISNQRMNGLQTGVASSQLQNKAMYQTSLVAYAIAQVMMQNGKNANDTDVVSTFVANLSDTMLQKVYDIATTAEAQAGAATGKWMSPALVKSAIDSLAAKAQNILSDETKVLFGLGSEAVPDDLFAWIGQYSTYWWSVLHGQSGETTYVHSTNRHEYPDSGYADLDIQLGNVETVTLLSGTSGVNADISKADSVHITIYPTFKLENPTEEHVVLSSSTTQASMNAIAESLRGKYFSTSKISGNIYYMEEDAEYSVHAGSGTLYIKVQAAQVLSVTSESEDYYTYFGVPFDNASRAPQIEQGSYVGTGSGGAQVQFSAKPLLIIVEGLDNTTPTNIHRISIYYTDSGRGVHFSGLSTAATITWDADTKTATMGDVNVAAHEYTYLAFCIGGE